LIEREYYTLDIAAGILGCSVSDFFHLGMQGKAEICVNILGLATDTHRRRIIFDPSDALDQEIEEIEMPGGFYQITADDLAAMDMPDSFPFELSEAIQFFMKSWWEVEFEIPVTIGQEHLCIRHAELEWLKLFMKKKTHLHNKVMSENERQKMLMLIIGMAIDAYDPVKTRNKATGDNKDGISARIQTRGISVGNDTILKYLTEAKKLI
jgi:hypothetical protein